MTSTTRLDGSSISKLPPPPSNKIANRAGFHCPICGRKLTDPKSIALGFGFSHLKAVAGERKHKVDLILQAKGVTRQQVATALAGHITGNGDPGPDAAMLRDKLRHAHLPAPPEVPKPGKGKGKPARPKPGGHYEREAAQAAEHRQAKLPPPPQSNKEKLPPPPPPGRWKPDDRPPPPRSDTKRPEPPRRPSPPVKADVQPVAHVDEPKPHTAVEDKPKKKPSTPVENKFTPIDVTDVLAKPVVGEVDPQGDEMEISEKELLRIEALQMELAGDDNDLIPPNPSPPLSEPVMGKKDVADFTEMAQRRAEEKKKKKKDRKPIVPVERTDDNERAKKTPAGQHLEAGGSVSDAPNEGLADYMIHTPSRFEIQQDTINTGVSPSMIISDKETGESFFLKQSIAETHPHMAGDAMQEVLMSSVLNDLMPGQSPLVRFASDPNASNSWILSENVHDKYPSGKVLGSDQMTENRLSKTDPSDIFGMHILDYVTNNTDRHGGNYIFVSDGKGSYKLIVIDNGLIGNAQNPAYGGVDYDTYMAPGEDGEHSWSHGEDAAIVGSAAYQLQGMTAEQVGDDFDRITGELRALPIEDIVEQLIQREGLTGQQERLARMIPLMYRQRLMVADLDADLIIDQFAPKGHK